MIYQINKKNSNRVFTIILFKCKICKEKTNKKRMIKEKKVYAKKWKRK